MPTESRSIAFCRTELLAAIGRHMGPALAAGAAGRHAEIELSADPAPQIVYVLRDDAAGPARRTALEPATVAAALIRYCIAEKIPMPRKASKSLRVHADHVSLVLRIG